MPPLDSILVAPCTETMVLVELAESMVLHVRTILALSGVMLCTACLPFVSDTHLTLYSMQPLKHELEHAYVFTVLHCIMLVRTLLISLISMYITKPKIL